MMNYKLLGRSGLSVSELGPMNFGLEWDFGADEAPAAAFSTPTATREGTSSTPRTSTTAAKRRSTSGVG